MKKKIIPPKELRKFAEMYVAMAYDYILGEISGETFVNNMEMSVKLLRDKSKKRKV